MTDFNPQEEALLNINGVNFRDWESVWVQHRWTDSSAYFRFTAVERDPLPYNLDPYSGFAAAPVEGSLWARQVFSPGQKCYIELGGKLAMNGWINTRQVAYNATSHQTQLLGKSTTWWGYKSSVDDKNGNFDGYTFEQIARQVLAPYDAQIEVVGDLDTEKYKDLQVNPGETCWDFLERIARPRGIILGSSPEGHYLLIGKHTKPLVHDLIEGQNIKAAQFIFHLDDVYLHYDVTGQAKPGDDGSGKEKNELRGTAPGMWAPAQSRLITPAEWTPNSIEDLMKRAKAEARWHDGAVITANITVQGWLRGGTDLWRVGDNVFVNSPMAPLQQTMKINTATFTQDNQSGTQTQLELVLPWLLGDEGRFNVNDTNPPGNPKPVPPVAATPPRPPVPPPSSRTPPTFGRGS